MIFGIFDRSDFLPALYESDTGLSLSVTGDGACRSDFAAALHITQDAPMTQSREHLDSPLPDISSRSW
jgi:hypothetical protein